MFGTGTFRFVPSLEFVLYQPKEDRAVTAEYDNLRVELEDVQSRFESLSRQSPDLRHEVCCCWDKGLSAAIWEAFKGHNELLSDGRWHQWKPLNGGRWCGRIHGTGALVPQFEVLATEAVSVLERLSNVAGAGEYCANMPSQPPLDIWLRLIYDTGELCGVPEVRHATWKISETVKPSYPVHEYW